MHALALHHVVPVRGVGASQCRLLHALRHVRILGNVISILRKIVISLKRGLEMI